MELQPEYVCSDMQTHKKNAQYAARAHSFHVELGWYECTATAIITILQRTM